ncbi:MAG TPA: caspase family protein [Halomicronema sp.]
MNNIGYALVVGITDYEGLPSLTKPSRDAEAVAQRLEKQGNFVVERLPKGWNAEKNCYEITEERLTGKQLGEALLRFLEQVKGNEAVIYFSGHGITVTDELGQKKGYLAASDCAITMQNKQIFGQQHGICLDSLNTLISKADFEGLAVILDCCHAAYFLEGNSLKENLSVFTYKPHTHLIAACRSFASLDEDRRGKGYSAFTTILLEALQPQNANSEGNVGVEELYNFLFQKLAFLNSKKNITTFQLPIRMGLGRSVALVSYPSKPTTSAILETSPYQGLKAFTLDSSSFFFGRDAEIQALRQKLELNNFVGIIGAAGSGKTSLLLAGLVPLMQANNWQVLKPILPGKEPLESLKNAFAELLPNTEITTIYDGVEKAPNLDWLVKLFKENQRVLLVIDCLEEIFTLCESETERQRFIEILEQIAALSCHRFIVAFSLRADFLEHCLRFPILTNLLQDKLVYLSYLNSSNLEKIISFPVKLKGYELEEGLLQLLQKDFSKVQGNLGLLEFTLTQLWQQRDRENSRLTLESYQQINEPTKILNNHAENLYETFSPQQQEWVKSIFLNLLIFTPDFKIVVRRESVTNLLQIAANTSHLEEINGVLNKLIDGGLLMKLNVFQQPENVTLSGEILINKWERLAEWCWEKMRNNEFSNK